MKKILVFLSLVHLIFEPDYGATFVCPTWYADGDLLPNP
jgi:hypothetical protein